MSAFATDAVGQTIAAGDTVAYIRKIGNGINVTERTVDKITFTESEDYLTLSPLDAGGRTGRVMPYNCVKLYG